MNNSLKLQLVLETLNKASAPLKKIGLDSSKTAKQLKASRDALRQLQRQQRDISSFEKVSSATKETADQLAYARRKVESLTDEIAANGVPTAAMTKRFKAATTVADKLAKTHELNRQKLITLKSALKNAGISTGSLDNHQQQLNTRIKQTNAAIEHQHARLNKLAAAQKRYSQLQSRGAVLAAKSAVGMYAGQRAAGGVAGLVNEGFDFDAAMSQVQALTRLNKENDRMIALRVQARTLGANTSFTASEAASGQSYLAMAGFTPQAILDAMPGMLSLAKSAGAELGEAADISSNILTGFKLNANQMGMVGDTLTATFTRSNTTLQMLGETMGYVAPIASELGGNINEVSALAGKLGDAGIQGSMAGTALRAIYGRIAAPPKDALAALTELNIQTLDANGNLLPMISIIKQLSNATQGLGDAQKAGLFKDIAGDEAFGALSVLVNQAKQGELTKFLNIIKAANGEAAATASIMSDNARGDLKAFRSAWSDVLIGLEETKDGPIRQLIQDATALVRTIGQWTQANPELTAGIIKWAGVLAAVVAVLSSVGLAAAGVMMGLGTLLKLFTTLRITALLPLAKKALPAVLTALRALSLFLITNPIGLTITGIATAAFIIYKNWEPIKAFFKNLWAEVKAAFDGGLLDILALLLNWSPLGILYQSIQHALDSLGIELPGKFTEFGSMLINGLIDGIKNKLGDLKSSITGVASSASEWFKDKLGIRSPSRVFINHGSDVMAGLEKGLANNRNTLRPLMNMSQRVKNVGAGLAIGSMSMGAAAFDNRPPLQARAAQTAGSSISVGAIHVHAAPGMDEQALARLVATELAKLQHQHAASRRSNLSDED